VGRTTFQRVQLDATGVGTQPELIAGLAKRADPDLVLDVRIVGVRPDELDLHIDEIESALAPSFLKVRVRDVSLPALTEGTLPSPDTVVGAFIRDLEADRQLGRPTRPTGQPSCATHSAWGGAARRPRSRWDRRLELRLRRYRHLAVDLAPGLTVIRGPNEAGKSTMADVRAHDRRVTSSAGDLDAFAVGRRRGRALGHHRRFRAGRRGRREGRATREDLRRVARDGPARL
jgi:hypothetical protein